MKGIYIMIDSQLLTPEQQHELEIFMFSGSWKDMQQRCFAMDISYVTLNRYRKKNVKHPVDLMRYGQLRILIDLYNQHLEAGEQHAENTSL